MSRYRIRNSDYEADLCMVLGRARYDKALQQEILRNVATYMPKPDEPLEPSLEWRQQLALAFGWQPIGNKEEVGDA